MPLKSIQRCFASLDMTFLEHPFIEIPIIEVSKFNYEQLLNNDTIYIL